MTDAADELIETTLAYHRGKGRPEDCEVIQWLKAQKGRSAQAVRAGLIARADWKPGHSVEGILTAARLPANERAAAQALYAGHLIKTGDARDRMFAAMKLAPVRDQIDAPTLARLDRWIRGQ